MRVSVKRLPRTVLALGLVSLFTDLSSEMIYPLLPAFLVALHAGGTFIGLVEGIAESTAAFLKLASGIWSDRLAARKPLVVLGYGIASIARPLTALARVPWHVLAIRFSDRVGKGIRTSPRDALIAHATPADRRGLAYGFHRAMDHLGALLGPLAAYGLLALGFAERRVFALAAVPAALAMVVLIFGVRERREPRAADRSEPSSSPEPGGEPLGGRPRLPRTLLAYLGVVGVFTLGNASDAFLLLRAVDGGVPVTYAPLLWAALHAVKSSLSTPLGALSDRLGRRAVIVVGWLVYALVYLGFAFASTPRDIWALFLVYGAYFALVEGAEKALVADLAPAALRGRAFGAFHFVIGALALPASFGFGLLWQYVSHRAAFLAGAGLATVAALGLLALLAPRGRRA